MDLEFAKISLNIPGKPTNKDGSQWAKLAVGLFNNETDHHHSATVSVMVSDRPDATIRELRAEALDSAIEILEAAARALRGKTVEDLQADETLFEQRLQDKDQADFAESLKL